MKAWMLLLGLFTTFDCLASSVAIITHDRAVMRSAARPSAQANATLLQGEAVEVRGEKLDYVQVYDYRRERGGFVKASQVRRLSLKPEDAPGLLAVVRFVRDTPNMEPLGIALATLYLQTAPAAAPGADSSLEEGIEALDAIGVLADRLAQRASPEQLEVAARYGVQFRNVEREGRIRVSYDGEAFRRVLALPASAEQRARAALVLTRRECSPSEPNPVLRMRVDAWRAEVLDRVDTTQLAPHLRNRIAMRRAGVWASLAYYRARGFAEVAEPAAPAAQRALAELSAIQQSHLLEEDTRAYADALRRVEASRWAASPPRESRKGIRILTTAGKPGETCITLVDRQPRLKRCTYGVVWTASAKSSKDGSALSLAVQQTETWQEKWVFRRKGTAWTVQVLPPSMASDKIPG